MAAAIATEAAAKQGKFWEMHDKLFENNKDMTDANILKWAKELKLNVGQFKKDLVDRDVEDSIKTMQSEGITLGARGTPAFFVNGRFLSGAQPVSAFEKVINEELKKAEKLVASGTARKDVYEAVIKYGATKPE